jgi:hypothetical protein
MLTRIVKITFQEEKLTTFFEHFETVKWKVASFPGCHGMKLLKEPRRPKYKEIKMNTIYPSWNQWLNETYWNIELENDN